MIQKIFIFIFLVSCQSKLKEPVLEFGDLTKRFQSLDKETQQKALENKWAFFRNTFSFHDFETKMLEEFPSLNVFPSQSILSGKTLLDLALNSKTSANPALLLLAIDLEMELLARFHSNDGVNSPRCLESLWSEWGFPVPAVTRGPFFNPNLALDSGETLNQKTSTQSSPNSVAAPPQTLSENESRMALLLNISLGLDKKNDLTLISSEGIKSAKFKLKTGEIYEIFSAPLSCKEIASKETLMPLIGKLTCLQKGSSAWVSFLSQENSFLNDQWFFETQKACQRWIRPLSDILHKTNNEKIQKSPLSKSWSLYPRLRARILREADRFESAFRKSLE